MVDVYLTHSDTHDSQKLDLGVKEINMPQTVPSRSAVPKIGMAFWPTVKIRVALHLYVPTPLAPFGFQQVLRNG
jgi:hypothetical protein